MNVLLRCRPCLFDPPRQACYNALRFHTPHGEQLALS